MFLFIDISLVDLLIGFISSPPILSNFSLSVWKLFIKKRFIYLFMAMLGFPCCMQAFFSCGIQASHCGSHFSCCGAQVLGIRASVAACGLSSGGSQALELWFSSCDSQA